MEHGGTQSASILSFVVLNRCFEGVLNAIIFLQSNFIVFQ